MYTDQEKRTETQIINVINKRTIPADPSDIRKDKIIL